MSSKRKSKSTPEMQALILFALLARDQAAAFQNELKPEPDKADRDALEGAGLIKCEKRGRYRRIWIEVTERGWDWADSNLGATLPAGSPAGSKILEGWLIKLQSFMRARGVALADILGPQQEASTKDFQRGDAASDDLDYAEIRERIRSAYLHIAGGFNKRALLSAIRAHLSDIARPALDEALKRMEIEDQASLMPLDNRIDIAEADRDAALYVGREPRHILWIVR